MRHITEAEIVDLEESRNIQDFIEVFRFVKDLVE